MSNTLRDLIKPQAEDVAGEAFGRARAAAMAAKVKGVKLSKVADEPLERLMGIGAPFRDPSITLGSGARSKRVAGAMDTLGRAVRFGNIPGTEFSPGSAVTRLLHAPAGDATSRVGQEFLMPQIFEGRKAAKVKAREFVGDVTHQLKRKGGTLAEPSDVAASGLRKTYEGQIQPTPEFAGTHAQVRAKLDKHVADADEWGINLRPQTGSTADYFPRHGSVAMKKGRTTQASSAFDTASIQRKPWLVGIKGETEQLRDIIRDPHIEALIGQKAPTKQIADYIQQRYGNVVPPTFSAKVKKTGVVKDFDRYEALAKHIESMPEDTRKLGLFGNHPHADLLAREVSAEQALNDAKGVIANLANDDVLAHAKLHAKTADTIPLGKLFKNANFHPAKALKKFAKLRGVPTPTKDDIKAFAKTPVPMDLAEDIARHMQKVSGPDAANEIIQAVDSFTNLFKAGVTGMAPAFHVRNLFSGQFQNWLNDTFSGRSVKDAHDIVRGHAIDATDIPAVQHMLRQRQLPNTPENATDMLRELAHQHEIIGNFGSEPGSVVGRANSGVRPTSLRDVMAGFPGGLQGSSPYKFSDLPKKAVGLHPETNLKPWDIRGVGGRTESGFGPAAAGQDLGYYIESLNRLSPFIHELRKGTHPAEAARKMLEAQIDYGGKNYTNFERKILHRAVPFAKFSTGIAKHTAKTLAKKPGGKLAQTIRAMESGHGADATTPDYVADTASVPLGRAADGSKRYITGFGLMPEDPLSFFGGGVRGAGMEAISRANPLIKAPIEWFTGQSFFQKGPLGGRPLEDMDPLVGRIVSNITGKKEPSRVLPHSVEFALANSPLSRGLSTLRTATDPRKRNIAGAANLLTGLRISDISPAAQDAVLRERAAVLMKDLGARSYAEVYFPKDMLAQMPPDVRAKAEELQALMKHLGENAKTRKKAKAAQMK
jgi:hypothetical protein